MFSRLTSHYNSYNFVGFVKNFFSNLNSESFLIFLTINLLILKLSYQYGIKGTILTILIIIISIICLVIYTSNQIFRAKLFLILIINLAILFFNILSINITNRNKIIDIKKDFKVTLIPFKEMGLTASSNQDFFIIRKLVPPVAEWKDKRSVITDEYYKGNIPLCSKIEFWANIEYSQNSDFLSITNIRFPENKGSYSRLIINQLEKRVGEISSIPVTFGWAMLTGSKALISERFLDKLRSTGTLHLFAVSGLHIGFLYMFITVLCFPLKNKFYINLPLKIFFCFLYLILSWNASNRFKGLVDDYLFRNNLLIKN